MNDLHPSPQLTSVRRFKRFKRLPPSKDYIEDLNCFFLCETCSNDISLEYCVLCICLCMCDLLKIDGENKFGLIFEFYKLYKIKLALT